MNSRLQRGLIFILVLTIPFLISLLFTYEVLKIPFTTDMQYQASINYQEGPRLLPPEDAVPIQGLAIIPDEFPENPITADDVSLQRGKILFDIHCQICHGVNGHGDGPLAQYFERTPENLTGPQISAEFDGAVYLTIRNGFGQMPALSENLTPHETWDVVNYLHTLPVR
ncbi:MAG: cytochrome c [Chloroflexota bacterium]|nr:MAG: cytochrome c [Chloroflexota bacterium]